MPGPYTPNPNDPTRPAQNDEVQYGAGELRALKTATSRLFSCRDIVATSYTLIPDDVGNMVNMVNGGTITIPLSLGTGLVGITGSGQVNILGASGVTVQVEATLQAKTYGTHAFAVVMRKAANVWLLAGNLAFAPVAP